MTGKRGHGGSGHRHHSQRRHRGASARASVGIPLSLSVGWENFLRHVVAGAPLTCDLCAGIADVQLAEACYRGAAEQKWIMLDDIAG
jgi:hypothetical protein